MAIDRNQVGGSLVKQLKCQEDFQTWKFQVSIILKSKNLYKFVEGEEDSSKTEVTEQYKAQEILIGSLDEKVLRYVINCKSAKEIWDKLIQVFEQDDMIKTHVIQQKFFNYKWENLGMAYHISEIENLALSLEQKGDKISEELKMTKILMTLPQSYTNFQTVWEAVPSKDRNMKTLTQRLCSEEGRVNMYKQQGPIKSEDVALYSNVKCFKCGTKGHLKKNCTVNKWNPPSTSRSPSSKFCTMCKRKGHTNQDCWFSKSKIKENKRENAMVVSTHDEISDDWFIDSGATAHICKNIDYFKDMQQTESKFVSIGNGQQLKVVGIGTIIAETYDGNSWIHTTLTDVNYVPEMEYNLFSTNATLHKGYDMKVNLDTWSFTLNGEVRAIGFREGKMFKMKLRIKNNTNEQALVSKVKMSKHSLYEWHIILGHQNIEMVKQILKENNISACKSETFFCASCMHGKQHRLPFKNSTTVSKDVGDLVVADVCGPMEENSIAGSRYFLLIKDDFSKHRSVFFMKNKGETKSHISSYMKKFENLTGRKIKIFRTDNGLEEVNREVKEVTDSLGITHQKSCPFTPQQNGKAERDIRTIVEGARTLLFAAKLEKKFWAEAINYMVFTLNNSVCTANGIPIEIWSGVQKTDISCFHPFGSAAFVHIPKVKRKKWDRKSDSGIFMGYDTDVKGYRVYSYSKNKVEISRDVLFGPLDYADEIFLPDSNNGEENRNIDFSTLSYDHIQSEPGVVQNSDFVVHAPTNSIMDIGQPNEFTSIQEQDSDDNAQTNDSIIQDETFDLQNDSQQDESEIDNNHEEEQAVTNDNQERPVNRLRRNIKMPEKYKDYVLLTFENEPHSYNEAINSDEKENWKKAMEKELSELNSNNTWNVVSKSANMKTVSCKWVFKKKFDGDKPIYKARLVARGFQQAEHFDFDEIYAPVAKLQTLRILLAVSSTRNYKIHQMDVVSAFLHGDINEEVFMEVPDGCNFDENSVLKLKKSIYGLRKSPKYWYEKLNNFIIQEKFIRSQHDLCLYSKDNLKILVYVDDILLFSDNDQDLTTFKVKLCNAFKMKDMGPVSKFVGIQIKQTEGKIILDQKDYLQNVLKSYNMEESKPVSTPIEPNFCHVGDADPKFEHLCRSVIGSLLYAALCTRPDIMIAVTILARYQNKANSQLWTALKRVLRYIQGTLDLCLVYNGTHNGPTLEGYADSDWAGDTETRRSTSGFIFKVYNCVVVWSSRRQNCVALSTAESEYVALSEAVSELVWLVQILKDIGIHVDQPTVIYEDNQSAIKIASGQTKKTKHIDIKYHFVREKVNEKLVKILYIDTQKQLADLLTKPLTNAKLEILRENIGLQKE